MPNFTELPVKTTVPSGSVIPFDFKNGEDDYTTSQIAKEDILVALKGYASLVLSFTQSGSDAPVSSVVTNETGAVVPVWSRNASPVYYQLDLSSISGTIFLLGLFIDFSDSFALSQDIYDVNGIFKGRTVIHLSGVDNKTLTAAFTNDSNTLSDFSAIVGSDTSVFLPEIRFYQ